MSVQRIPIESVQKIRQYIKTVLSLPASENHPQSWAVANGDELPEPDSLNDLGALFNFGGPIQEETYAPNSQGHWFISVTNPGAALLKLPGLTLNPEMRLATYLYRVSDDGVGVTWAVPESLSTTACLEKALAAAKDRNHPPQPNGALKDVMEAVVGDRSPASYIVASILRRELQEFGAIGRSCNWTHHRLIGALPTQAQWQWRVKTPQDLSPKVRVLTDGQAATEFFTCRVAAPIAIFQHVDQYSQGQYCAVSINRPIAVIQRP